MLTDGSKVEIYLAPFCLVFIKNELKGQLYTPILISDREQFLIGYLTYCWGRAKSTILSRAKLTKIGQTKIANLIHATL